MLVWIQIQSCLPPSGASFADTNAGAGVFIFRLAMVLVSAAGQTVLSTHHQSPRALLGSTISLSRSDIRELPHMLAAHVQESCRDGFEHSLVVQIFPTRGAHGTTSCREVQGGDLDGRLHCGRTDSSTFWRSEIRTNAIAFIRFVERRHRHRKACGLLIEGL